MVAWYLDINKGLVIFTAAVCHKEIKTLTLFLNIKKQEKNM